MLNSANTNILNLKRYFLGNLSPAENESIDRQIIEDESLEDKLYLAESELLEDYLDDSLSPSELKLFAENFLVSAERKTQLKQISMLRKYARKPIKDVSKNFGDKKKGNFFAQFKSVFSFNPRPVFAVLTIVCTGLLVAAILFYTPNQQSIVEKEFAALNQTNFNNPAEFATAYTVNLTSGTFRGDDSNANKLPADKLGEKVFFRLALPVASETSETFNIELTRDQKNIFTQYHQHIYHNQSGSEIRLFLPSSFLKPGKYQIKAAKEGTEDSVFTYSFAVV